jgi:hypothetical protein
VVRLPAVLDDVAQLLARHDGLRHVHQGVEEELPAPSSLEICFASPHTFITKSGAAAQAFDYDGDPANGAEGFVGLLPNSPQVNNPCVDKRGGLNGGAIVTFLVPAAWSDPRYH